MGGCLKKINPVDYLRPVVRCNRCNKYNANIIPDHAELVTAIAQEGVESFLESNFDLDDMAIRALLQENMEAMQEIAEGDFCICTLPQSINKWKL
jgi:hypothetical protein